MKIVGLCGSLRKLSCNRGMLRSAQKSAPPGTNLEIAEIGNLPLYNMDIDPTGGGAGGGPNPYNITKWPATVKRLRDQVSAADAVLAAVGENNGHVPAPLINALAWLSRAEHRDDQKIQLLDGKTFAMMGCAGGSGGKNGRLNCVNLVQRLKIEVIDEYVDSKFFSDQYDLSSGDVVGDELKESIRVLVDALVNAVASR